MILSLFLFVAASIFSFGYIVGQGVLRRGSSKHVVSVQVHRGHTSDYEIEKIREELSQLRENTNLSIQG